MSNISLNLSYDDDSARRRPASGNRGRSKVFQNHRTHAAERRGLSEVHDPAANGPRSPARPRNGDFTRRVASAGSQRPRGTGSAPTSSHRASTSTHRPQPCAANNGGGRGKPAGRKQAMASGHKPAGAAQTTATTSSSSLSSSLSSSSSSAPSSSAPSSSAPSSSASSSGIPTKYLALDCEMVGTGPKGSISQLARCSLVSYEGDVVYDKFINPSMPVTDYRTRWSGIRRCDLVNATPYSEARKEILRLLMGKVVIGHAVHNDFKVLGYSHPAALTRDTSRIPLLNQRAGFAVAECASLKRLTKAIFNRDIQVNAAPPTRRQLRPHERNTGRKGHSSVEDAKATMELYKVVEVEWERKLASRSC